ncbi:protein CutA homolog [Drosophila mauritiana]|uniref:Protein CutA homolog n=1 Tax=Drosophila mauritiana TaxID=7226 RepID=A0A6P8L1E6_DROMA|nr:protein CutA homolog [Drosophila mauritiana]
MQYRISASCLPFRWSLVRNLLIAASVTTAIANPPAFAAASSRKSCFSSSAANSSSSSNSNSNSSECSKMGDQQPGKATGNAYEAGSSSVAFVTTPDRESARKLARSIVELKLAACVNIVSQVESVYMWEGVISEDPEYLLMIKTRTSRIDDLSKFIRENHPYSVAEVIALPIQNGNPPYLDWIAQTVPTKAESKD